MYAANLKKFRPYAMTMMALTLVSFGYQNCARTSFGVDEASKSMAIDKENVFGTDPTNGVGNETGSDPVTSANGSFDVNFSFVCSDKQSNRLGTNLIEANGLKAVVVSKKNPDVKVCEIAGDLRADILNKKKATIKLCAAATAGEYKLLLVESTVTSDYAKKSLIDDDLSFKVAANGAVTISSKKVEIVYDINAKSSKYKTSSEIFGNSSAATQKSCDSNASPLIVSMNSQSRGIQLSAPLDGIQFDILGERSNPYAHAKKQISWLLPQQEYYFITLPKEGVVSGIDEMFGDNTKGPDGKFAANGYAALAKYDDDGDRMITPHDEIYSKLRLWNDLNRDGLSEPNELFTLEEMNIEIIDLRYDKRYREVDAYGNETLMKSVVKTKDGELHLLFDLWFRPLNLTY